MDSAQQSWNIAFLFYLWIIKFLGERLLCIDGGIR